MRIKFIVWAFCLLSLLANTRVLIAQSGTGIEAQIEKIKNAEKVEQLYSVRYNLDKLSANGNLPVNEMRRVLEAHVMLADEFEIRNHFRNAADVYLDYLKLVDIFHKNYSAFLVDSVQKANNSEAVNYKENISKLDAEIASLTIRNEKVSGLRSKYFTFGGIATAVILLIFGVIFLSKNKSIRETNQKIAVSNQSIKNLFRDVIDSGMLSGAVQYTKSVMNENALIIDELLENKTSVLGQKPDESAVKSLSNARTSFLAGAEK